MKEGNIMAKIVIKPEDDLLQVYINHDVDVLNKVLYDKTGTYRALKTKYDTQVIKYTNSVDKLLDAGSLVEVSQDLQNTKNILRGESDTIDLVADALNRLMLVQLGKEKLSRELLDTLESLHETEIALPDVVHLM